MKKLLTSIALSLSVLPQISHAYWPGYPVWPPVGSPFYTVPRPSWYNSVPYYPYVVDPPMVSAVPQNPNLTIPPLPQQIAPDGFKWTTIVDSSCQCVRWVLVPSKQ